MRAAQCTFVPIVFRNMCTAHVFLPALRSTSQSQATGNAPKPPAFRLEHSKLSVLSSVFLTPRATFFHLFRPGTRGFHHHVCGVIPHPSKDNPGLERATPQPIQRGPPQGASCFHTAPTALSRARSESAPSVRRAL